MKKLLLVTLCALPLAAFSSAVQRETEAGQWELAIDVDQVTGPGVPPELLTQLEQQIETAKSRSCWRGGSGNQLQAMRDGILAGLNPGGQEGMSCEFAETDSWTGGSFRVNATCRAGGRTAVTLAIYGGYTRSSVEADLLIDVRGGGGDAEPGVSIRIGGKMKARRLGGCI
jgi:hypothetical protein